MTYHQIATYRFDPDRRRDEISLGRERGMWKLVFPGPGGFEDTIEFDRVDVDDDAGITLFVRTAEGRVVKTGSLGGAPEHYGAVGTALELLDEGEDPREVAVGGA